jgi:ABC-type transport system involved in multi-copper enzyme maturation permease subunit
MNPAVNQEIISSRTGDGSLSVPASWRIRQAVLIGIVALIAAWYFMGGYKSQAPEVNSADSATVLDALGFAAIGLLIWLTTPTAWTVAVTTFHEAIRRKWMTALLGFALVMLACSTFFTWMQPGEEQKFLRDFGVGFTVIMTLIVAVFLGVALIPPEIERRTIFTILSKPVNRLEFLIGKYVGLLLVLAANLALMAGLFLICYARFVIDKEGDLSHAMAVDYSGVSKMGLVFDLTSLARAFVLHFGTLAIMAAITITLSQVLANMTAIIAAFVIYFGGQSASYWEHLAKGTDTSSAALPPIVATLVNTIYVVLPRLDRFDARERLVNDLPVGLNYIVKAEVSGALYAAALLAVAYYLFSDREF